MGETRRVVLAEDDEDIRTLVTRTLDGEFEVEAFESGTACWERLESGPPPDVLLLDVMLPGTDGLDLYDRVQADDRLSTVSVVFLTGRDESDLVAAVGEEVDYVAKPFSPSELRERLRALTG
ncbi:response regulator transcription factor [Natronomonas marina]|jgi:DNA-binding response OmpR family regulator|uniref:response regulator transcription factor n=1 Tax=Natronomonas marina TaxID=2961939 RepID=UPI0020C94696|nr:response regulator [Natronomonas marina]